MAFVKYFIPILAGASLTACGLGSDGKPPKVEITAQPAIFVTATESTVNQTNTSPPPTTLATAIPPSATALPAPTVAATIPPIPESGCFFNTNLASIPLSEAPLSNFHEITETTLTVGITYPVLQTHFEHFNIVVDDSAGWVDRRAGFIQGDCENIPEDETSLTEYQSLCWFNSNVNQPTYADPERDSRSIASVEAGHSYVALQRHPDGFYLLYYDHAFSAWVDASAGQISGGCDDLTSPGMLASEARVWSEPDVYSGSVLATLDEGSSIRIISQPTTGPIRLDSDEQGDWHKVQTSDRSISGWVWAGALAFK